MKKKVFNHLRKLNPGEIQTTIMVALSVISISIVLCMGIVMYVRFSALIREDTLESTQKLMEQTGESLEDYLANMRQISEAAYYNVIKENDFSSQTETIEKGMNLLYEANKDSLRSIAIYDSTGKLMTAEPVVSQKNGLDVTRQDWFYMAMEEPENIHFSTPHIQNLFDDGTLRYYWVISTSRVVEFSDKADAYQGVLLVDMDYAGISRMMNQINNADNGYYYLCDSNGEIIYHPKQVQINNGIIKESSREAAGCKEGVYDETFEGEHRQLIVNTISYTGWKLVGVIPDSIFNHELLDIQQFIVMLALLTAMMLIVVSRIVSARISSPILKLNNSVLEYETGKESEIYIGGSLEIRHLGESIQESYKHNERLMKEIVREQNERRKSELEALQSQINPHFLYNTLDSIIWTIEGGRNDDASFMVSELAKLFRISLSKGHTIISVKDELQHARSYMNIQNARYKDAFDIRFDIEPELGSYCAVKLTLQPILENAINYGIHGNEDGQIQIIGRKKADKIIISIEDNGIGIPAEIREGILTNNNLVPKKGSGVGLVNVNNRIQILFGKEYGLLIESEPDEGTCVSVCLPAILHTEENRAILEQGYQFSKEAINLETDKGSEKDEEQ